MSSSIIGIDLGTTTSVVSITDGQGGARVLADSDGVKIQPSVVSFPPTGKVLVGAAAKQRKVIDPQNTVYSVKRLMGRTSSSAEVNAIRMRVPYQIAQGDNQQPVIKTRAGNFSPSEVSALILDHMRALARKQVGEHERLDRAVVTVPANFAEAQRSATVAAGEIAGITVVRVLNEPTAAAIAYGQKKRLSKLIAVYDFGGGTFDVSLLKLDDEVFEVVGTSGDSMLGGDDIDERLVEGMVEEFLATHRVDLRSDPQAMMRLRQLAEHIKIELSRRTRSTVKLDEVAYGAGGKPLDLEVEMTRAQFEHKIGSLVEATFPVCDEALRLGQVSKDQITDVVLVGGTSRIPYVRQRVAAFFGKEPRTDINPDEAVAIGAGIQAESVRQVLDGRTSSSITVPDLPATESGDTITEVDPSLMSAGPKKTRRYGTMPPPPPVSPGRRTAQQAAVPPPTPAPARQGTGDDEDTKTAANPLGRIPLVKSSAGVREVAEVGAVRQPYDDSVLPAAVSQTLDRLDPDEDLPTTRGPRVQDVTPYSLGIATVGGYCEQLVRRNAQLPVTRERVFTNARDGQVVVRIQVCQGESRILAENQVIGDLVLDNLPARARGETKISVSFSIDESGIIQVRARDQVSGREQRARLNVLGAQAPEAVAAARDRMRQLIP